MSTALLIGNDAEHNLYLTQLLGQHQISCIPVQKEQEFTLFLEQESYQWIFIDQDIAFSAQDNWAKIKNLQPKASCIVLTTPEKLQLNTCLQHHVSFYLCKSLDATRLEAVLTHTQAPDILAYQQYNLRTFEEAKSLAEWITRIHTVSGSVSIGLSEILLNAVEHGNLGISYELKSILKNNNTWLEEIERRLQLPEYQKKFVDIQVARFKDTLQICIKDQGNGFDWKKFSHLEPSQIRIQHGRGIFMASQLSFTTMEYLGCGNEVLCTVSLTS